MRTKCLGLLLVALLMPGCGGSGGPSGDDNSPACFEPQPGHIYLDRNAIFVANTGSSTVSAFQNPGPTSPTGTAPVCGSPFPMSAPPTALGGGPGVLSAPGKTISFFKVDMLTSVLTGPTATLQVNYTPVGVAFSPGFMYVASREGGVWGYAVSGTAQAPTFTEVSGSPFPAGSSPAGIAIGPGLYVANSQSNDISAFTLDPATGVPTPVPGSPFPAGTGPSSIQVVNLDFLNGGATVALVANKGSDNVSVFSVASDGSLTPVPGSPFAAGVSPSALAANYGLFPVPFVFVVNSGSNNVSEFRIDASTGVLTPVPGSPFPAGGTAPSSIAVGGAEFVGFGGLNGPYVYVANAGSNNMSVFVADLNTGVLTPVAGSPFPVGQSPQAVLYLVVPK